MNRYVLYSFVKGVCCEKVFDNLEEAMSFLKSNGFYNKCGNFYRKELENCFVEIELVHEI